MISYIELFSIVTNTHRTKQNNLEELLKLY